MRYRIESLMSARLFVAPQYAFDRVYFLSNLSGHLSLYAMFHGGSVPEPLLPPHIALQNPHLIGGHSFYVFPEMEKIMVMIDSDGDENYQPMLIPIDGGFPEPAFNNFFGKYRVHLGECDREKGIVYLGAERRDKPWNELYRGDLKTGKLTLIAESEFGFDVAAHSSDHKRLILGTGYSAGDGVACLWNNGKLTTLYGKLMKDRKKGEQVPLNGLGSAVFSPSGAGAIVTTSVFDDTYGLAYLDFKKPGTMTPIKLKGIVHKGVGEMENIIHLQADRYTVTFNIDGCSWVYEGVFNEAKQTLTIKHILVGREPFDGGMIEHLDYDKMEDLYIFSFSTATSPTQIYSVEGKKRDMLYRHTEEKILGISEDLLSKGEDASFISHDGLRVSARLYMPAKSLGFKGKRPVVYYIHGGPQGQERPDFAWFSMPLIQYLTLRGFAVFVPNVRGSSGYGLSYMKRVDRDWGGQDRLDHVHAMTKILPKDKRLDAKRAAVVGRSYGGYMTLMQAGLHPNLWKASCDMFGPYDLVTFSERIPETWKPYFKLAIGDPDIPAERKDLLQRSPKTHMHNMKAPMLVIQGRNDPRVVAAESEDLVHNLKKKGKPIELLVFENEGHDVLKYENRVTCYNAITDFFVKYLKP